MIWRKSGKKNLEALLQEKITFKISNRGKNKFHEALSRKKNFQKTFLQKNKFQEAFSRKKIIFKRPSWGKNKFLFDFSSAPTPDN